jgi:hypothetical protein
MADNIIRRMRFACWVIKVADRHARAHHTHTHTHTQTQTNNHLEHVILTAFHDNNDFANAPRTYVFLRLDTDETNTSSDMLVCPQLT